MTKYNDVMMVMTSHSHWLLHLAATTVYSDDDKILVKIPFKVSSSSRQQENNMSFPYTYLPFFAPSLLCKDTVAFCVNEAVFERWSFRQDKTVHSCTQAQHSNSGSICCSYVMHLLRKWLWSKETRNENKTSPWIKLSQYLSMKIIIAFEAIPYK